MNTANSVIYGWGVLILAGGGSFYFAKKAIDERRRTQEKFGTRPSEMKTWQQRVADSETAVLSSANSTPESKAAAQAAALGMASAQTSTTAGTGRRVGGLAGMEGRGVGVDPGAGKKMI